VSVLDLMPHERVADGVELYDATEILAREYPRKRSRAAARPPGQRIDAVFVHHSGSLGRAGLDGLRGAVRYVTTQRSPAFPGPPYHLWLPYLPLRDAEGRLVVFRACEDSYRAWHTGGEANDRGIGLCLQGKLGKVGPSPTQVEALEALIPWASQRYGLPWTLMRTWLGWHAVGSKWGGRDKPTCPGSATVEWLHGYIDRAAPVL